MIIDTKSLRIWDISMPISPDMPVYKGRAAKRPVITLDSDFNIGASYESRLNMNLHTGTHIDSQLHMIQGGEPLEMYDLKQLVTVCRVVDLTDAEDKITGDDLAQKDIPSGSFILLKTRNSYEDILEKDFIYLDKSGAQYLISKRIAGVGIDSLGIERNQPEHETHKLLLGSGIVIIEGLRLKEIDEGEYLLSAAPILLKNTEAAPARAILLR